MPPVSRVGLPSTQPPLGAGARHALGVGAAAVAAVHRTCSVARSVGMGTTSLGMSEMESPGMQPRASGGSGVSCTRPHRSIALPFPIGFRPGNWTRYSLQAPTERAHRSLLASVKCGRDLAELQLLSLLDDGLDLFRRHVGLGLRQARLLRGLHLRRQIAVWQQLHGDLRRPRLPPLASPALHRHHLHRQTVRARQLRPWEPAGRNACGHGRTATSTRCACLHRPCEGCSADTA